MATITQRVPGRRWMIGVLLGRGVLVMGVAAPVVTGFVVDLTHSLTGTLLVAGLVLVVGIVSYVVVLGRIEPIPEPTGRAAPA